MHHTTHSEPFTLAIAALTDTGQARKLNEDYVGYHLPEEPAIQRAYGALMVVCDGVGGAAAGEVASEHAVHYILNNYYQEPAGDSPEERLMAAIEAANDELYTRNTRSQQTQEMGTTVVAAVWLNEHLVVAYAGDSRAYLVREGQVTQVTEDHSWVAEMVRSGDLTPEEAERHPWRNRITRGLGMGAAVHTETRSFRTRAGDILVLCSDGLTRHLDDAEIADIVTTHPGQRAVRRLVDLANLRGGKDNISAMVAEWLPEQVARERAQLGALDEIDTGLPASFGTSRRLPQTALWLAVSGAALIVIMMLLSVALLAGRDQSTAPTRPPSGGAYRTTPNQPLVSGMAPGSSKGFTPTPTRGARSESPPVLVFAETRTVPGTAPLALSPNLDGLASTGANPRIVLLSKWQAGSELATTKERLSANIATLAFQSGSGQLVVGLADGTLELHGPDSRTFDHWPSGVRDPVTSLEVSSGDRRLFAGFTNGQVRVWRAPGDMSSYAGGESQLPVVDLSYSSRASLLASLDSAGVVRLWQVSDAGLEPVGQVESASAATIALAPDGQTLATGNASGQVELWNTRTGDRVAILQDEGNPLTALAFSPDGQFVGAGTASGTVTLWHLAGKAHSPPSSLPGQEIAAIAFSPDGQRLAAATAGGIVQVWHIRTAD